ncbi:MAG: prolipoprotein diacylglyceryl transferase [bacterium]|nr:prolipoprotein diacylglyceryl transferase [bacterium]
MYPVLFKIGGISVYSYGLMLSLAFLAAIYAAVRRARIININSQIILDLGLVVILSGIIGARIFFVMLNLDFYIDNPSQILRLDKGGLAVFGGVLFSIITVSVFCRIRKLNVWDIADVIAPSIALGQAIGRIGCFLNGCCWGVPTNMPCGVIFRHKELMPENLHGVPLHPVQLYNSFLNLLIFFILSRIFKNRKSSGEVFAFYLILHPFMRFWTEFLRGDNGKVFFNITIFQLISVLLCVSGIIILLIVKSKKSFGLRAAR